MRSHYKGNKKKTENSITYHSVNLCCPHILMQYFIWSRQKIFSRKIENYRYSRQRWPKVSHEEKRTANSRVSKVTWEMSRNQSTSTRYLEDHELQRLKRTATEFVKEIYSLGIDCYCVCFRLLKCFSLLKELLLVLLVTNLFQRFPFEIYYY